jgi:hypothetical protein
VRRCCANRTLPLCRAQRGAQRRLGSSCSCCCCCCCCCCFGCLACCCCSGGGCGCRCCCCCGVGGVRLSPPLRRKQVCGQAVRVQQLRDLQQHELLRSVHAWTRNTHTTHTHTHTTSWSCVAQTWGRQTDAHSHPRPQPYPHPHAPGTRAACRLPHTPACWRVRAALAGPPATPETRTAAWWQGAAGHRTRRPSLLLLLLLLLLLQRHHHHRQQPPLLAWPCPCQQQLLRGVLLRPPKPCRSLVVSQRVDGVCL